MSSQVTVAAYAEGPATRSKVINAAGRRTPPIRQRRVNILAGKQRNRPRDAGPCRTNACSAEGAQSLSASRSHACDHVLSRTHASLFSLAHTRACSLSRTREPVLSHAHANIVSCTHVATDTSTAKRGHPHTHAQCKRTRCIMSNAHACVCVGQCTCAWTHSLKTEVGGLQAGEWGAEGG
eukprot:6189710-Pleurochrysis_carterae.AAC.3